MSIMFELFNFFYIFKDTGAIPQDTFAASLINVCLGVVGPIGENSTYTFTPIRVEN